MKPNKKTLFLPIEILARELDSKLLIAHKVLEKNYSVVIGAKGAVYKIARSYGRGIYFYKDHTPLSSTILQELHATGLKIVTMDEEGLSWASPKIYIKRIDVKVLQVSDAIFTWGQKQYDLITKTLPGYDKKCHVVGNPRFDILNSKYRQFLKDQSKLQLSYEGGDYILINSMFTPGNWNPLLYGTPSYVEHMRDRGLIHNDEDFNFFTKVSENSTQLFNAYVSLIKNLSSLFPNVRFVIRPHPDEDQEKWRNLFFSVNNVAVENSGSAIYWILGAKALIYTGCTTAIEAWALNKPTLRYHPIPETEFGPYLPNHFGKTIKSEEDLVEEINVILNTQESNGFYVNPEYVQSYIKNVFTADAAENIVSVLESLYNKDGFLENKHKSLLKQLKMKVYLLYRFDIRKRWGSRIVSRIKRLLQKKNIELELEIARAKSQKFPDLTKKDIEDRLISIDKALGEKDKKKWKIIKVAPNTYRIEKLHT